MHVVTLQTSTSANSGGPAARTAHTPRPARCAPVSLVTNWPQTSGPAKLWVGLCNGRMGQLVERQTEKTGTFFFIYVCLLQ